MTFQTPTNNIGQVFAFFWQKKEKASRILCDILNADSQYWTAQDKIEKHKML